MDVVATRDIAEDEEIFIDYGLEWQEAWDSHVQNWKSPCTTSSSSSSEQRLSSYQISQMNLDKTNTDYHTWSDDHFTVCTRSTNLTKADNKEVIYIVKEGKEGTEESSAGETHTKVSNYRGITVNDEGFRYSQPNLDRQIPCKIITTTADDSTEIILFYGHSMAIEVYKGIKITQSSEITYLPKPFHSDMHHPRAFRHEIMIPDDIFPKQWMDLTV